VSAPLAPILVLGLVAVSDVWVYTDASRRVADGTPVAFRIGSLTIRTPVAWLVACVVLWILFFPAYLASRSRNG
jgi:hypothetical protein